MNNILLIAASDDYTGYNQKKGEKRIFALDKIFYKNRIIESINDSLVEIDIDKKNSQSENQKIFLIFVPQKYLEPQFYGKKGIKKSYNAKKLVVEKVNLFCFEEGIKRHYYSNELLDLCKIEFHTRLTSEIYSYGFSEYDNDKGYSSKGSVVGKTRVYGHGMKGDLINVGKLLFRSLTLDLLERICSYKKIPLMQSEITIIGNRENKDDVLSMTWKLSQLVKFITVLTSDEKTDWLETETEEIYNSTGLAISVSNNYKSVTINTDILINYGNIYELSNYEGLKRRTVIINNSLNDYSLGDEKFRIRNPLIDGIEVEFPKSFPNELKALTPRHFSTNQVAEIVLGSRHGWDESKIGESFKEEGYKIKKLIGSNMEPLG